MHGQPHSGISCFPEWQLLSNYFAFRSEASDHGSSGGLSRSSLGVRRQWEGFLFKGQDLDSGTLLKFS